MGKRNKGSLTEAHSSTPTLVNQLSVSSTVQQCITTGNTAGRCCIWGLAQGFLAERRNDDVQLLSRLKMASSGHPAFQVALR
jgi:hypothetical protein